MVHIVFVWVRSAGQNNTVSHLYYCPRWLFHTSVYSLSVVNVVSVEDCKLDKAFLTNLTEERPQISAIVCKISGEIFRAPDECK